MADSNPLSEWEEPAEPCPATFDLMASCLASWPRVPTLSRWMDQRETTEAQGWSGKREIVSPRKRPAIGKALKLDEPRPVLTWEQMQERLERMHG
jgi:hypothetical protein